MITLTSLLWLLEKVIGDCSAWDELPDALSHDLRLDPDANMTIFYTFWNHRKTQGGHWKRIATLSQSHSGQDLGSLAQ
ncbi:hypothetical protein [Mycobacterium uberis]|uniref:hypothetical protein n=1 Tax=Mycobacterium uberis TaxID=2162698 RepID=UPI000E30732B|nr:hypothetical protein [Mycobacterium uberis]